jgi:ketol-acid reductoisomerase
VLLAVGTDASGSALAKALSYRGPGRRLRAGAIETTFREEAVTDLYRRAGGIVRRRSPNW